MNIAVLITVFNRKLKTLKCLDSLRRTIPPSGTISIKVFLTDDGSTDGTADAIRSEKYPFEIVILPGTGSLYWNGGMINSWKAAMDDGNWDGYLWLNNDSEVLPEFWEDVLSAEDYCRRKYGKGGIYIGSTKDPVTGEFTYGGLVYLNKFTLIDRMVHPDGKNFQLCEAAHGNITYVSSDVVKHQGIFCEKYYHGVSDHDYSYLAHKAGFPVLVLPRYGGYCENDHPKDGGWPALFQLPLKERLVVIKSPFGLNLHNTLLFNKRCFPWRYPLILFSGYMKALFPKAYYRAYMRLRGVKLPFEDI